MLGRRGGPWGRPCAAVPPVGVEPTKSLPFEGSAFTSLTTGAYTKEDSNLRLPSRQEGALPLSYRCSVPRVGVEPTRAFAREGLSLLRLPFHHLGVSEEGLEPSRPFGRLPLKQLRLPFHHSDSADTGGADPHAFRRYRLSKPSPAPLGSVSRAEGRGPDPQGLRLALISNQPSSPTSLPSRAERGGLDPQGMTPIRLAIGASALLVLSPGSGRWVSNPPVTPYQDVVFTMLTPARLAPLPGLEPRTGVP